MFYKIIKSRIFITLVLLVLIFLTIWFWPAKVKEYDNGVTFSAKYARELGLEPEPLLDSIINDLKIKKIRLVAYWDEIEQLQNEYDFSDLDWQIEKAEENDLEVILTLGRRVPRWPECHTPSWYDKIGPEDKKEELLTYTRDIINRYKEYDSIKIWQVENEPFLTVYVPEICGYEVDKITYDRQIQLVRELDDVNRPILTTDSGNLGLWASAYKRGDMFGSTFYVYLANETIGGFRTVINHNFYNFKRLLMTVMFGKKPVYLIETSMEPWLVNSIPDSSIEEQLEFMNVERLRDVIDFSSKIRFDEQYLWGVEWWYYLEEKGHPEILNFIREEVFNVPVKTEEVEESNE
jgi:hypothetical protein